MFRHIAAFEWRYQLRSPVFWVGFLLAFGATTVDQIQIGSIGNVHKNSPFAILQSNGVMNVFAVFVVVAMVAGVVVRDDETGFAPIVRATSVSKFSYLVGRFAGATAAAWLVMAAVPLAIWIGAAMPWQDVEKIGPFRAQDYLYALVAFTLPTLLVISATFFAIATATRSMMWTYIGAVAMLMIYLLSRGALREPGHDTLAALSDPFGMSPLFIATKYWTATERNTLLPPLSGLMLWNRLLWGGIGLAVFALAYRMFRFEVRPETPRARKADKPPRPAKATKAAKADALLRAGALERRQAMPLPQAPATGLVQARAQWWALARIDMIFVFRSPAFFVLMVIGLLNSAGALWFDGEFYGSPSWPVTRLMVQALAGSFTLIPIILSVFYSSELVWRDRDRRMHEIVDATPASDWAHLLPKIVAVSLVLVASALVAVVGGMLVQTIKGYTHYAIGSYLLWFVWPTTVSAIQLAVLSVFVQVIVPHKYIGWGLMLLYIVSTIALGTAGFEHNLYNFGGTPQVPLSDFNGQDRFWIGQAWFQLYWSAFSLMLVALAFALWRRGTTMELRPRLARLGRRLRGPAGGMLAIGAVVFVASGGWIYYNTNVLDRYLPSPARDALLAEMEKKLLPFENVPQPRIAQVTLDVQLEPREARAVTHGAYVLVNRTTAPIAAIHLSWDELARLDAVTLDGAKVQSDFGPLHYRIYTLAEPIAPGASRTLGFTTTLEERGFANSRPLTRIVGNGSFLDNTQIAPRLGISRDGLLKERAKRRKYGLPPELRPRPLEDDSARQFNGLSRDADWVDCDITVSTDVDQTPIAPGYTQSDEIRAVGPRQRHVVRFRTDAPINNFFSIQSARYEVQHGSARIGAKDVDLAVYYQRGHEYNVDRMLAAMKTSLLLFSEKFSPYQFRQARIIEFPAYAKFAQSFANTIPYSEDIGFLGRYSDPEQIDIATYVTAHEIAHQWWGHQLVPADQQGGEMLTESFAQYSALLVMEQVYGRDQVRRFLKYELDKYLRSRGGEVVEELPLARVEAQPYIYYQKGTLAMYWAREMLGEEVVDRALSKLLAQFAFKGPPYPNTRDFLALLRAEAGPAHDALIADLFEKITLLDLKASGAVATARADGRYVLEFDIDARKLVADGKGVETVVPMDEMVELGAFTGEPGKKGFKAADVLVLEKRRITSGRQHVKLVVDRLPAFAGVDPYNKRIDRNSDDNLTAVSRR